MLKRKTENYINKQKILFDFWGGNMNWKNMVSKKRLIFLAVFLVAAFFAMKINFSAVVGADNQHFTLFQFFGPIAGAFLGSVFGIIAVAGAELFNYIVVGKEFTFINILRLLPMLFAVYYFAKHNRKDKISKVFMVVIPLAAMVLFIAHPIGGKAWYYSLYWLIPVLAVVLPKKLPGKLFFRSLGATFTAHAIGSIAWLYSVPMTAEQWIGLIPVVAYERLLFAAGVAVSYVAVNTLLYKVAEKAKVPSIVLNIDKRYLLSKKLLRINI